MTMALWALVGVSVLELLIWLPFIWRWHRIIAISLIVPLSTISGWVLADRFNLLAVALVLFSAYRVINLLRLVEGRLPDQHLRQVTRRTSLWLIVLQIISYGLAQFSVWLGLTDLSYFYLFAVVQLVLVGILYASLQHTLRAGKPKRVEGLADRDLPSLTVAIPARNETEDLQACLESLIASTYPKLEILVLDDCSQNRHTPEIIRDYAHRGVRFMAGKTPPKQWLAKNYAYAQLAEEANGEVLLFCGVDVRFEPDTLSSLVKQLLTRNKTMLSVLPRNIEPATNKPFSGIIQAMRYAWEIALPRRFFNRPPVLSTCWLIKREALEAAGGFAAVRQGVLQERYFALRAVRNNDGYSFIQSDDQIELTTVKGLPAQRATAVRTRYPQLHRRPELVVLVSLAELVVLVGPVFVALASIVMQIWWLALLATLGFVLHIVLFSHVMTLTYRAYKPRSLWLAVPAGIYDICLLNYSMWRYEFSEVIWKDRNVCAPLMQVTPHLPKL